MKTLAIFATLIAASLVSAGVAQAAETSLFSTEANARSVCGKGKVVWVLFDSPQFYRPGSPNYEKGKGERKGAYTCERAARAKGWLPG